MDDLILPTLFFLMSFILICGFFQVLVIVIEHFTQRTVTKKECKMLRRIAISIVIILLLSCTITYIKSKNSDVKVDNTPQQGLTPVDLDFNLEANETKTKETP